MSLERVDRNQSVSFEVSTAVPERLYVKTRDEPRYPSLPMVTPAVVFKSLDRETSKDPFQEPPAANRWKPCEKCAEFVSLFVISP